jgi:hypothetical protein
MSESSVVGVVVTGRWGEQAARTLLKDERLSITWGPSVTLQYFTTDKIQSWAVTEAL